MGATQCKCLGEKWGWRVNGLRDRRQKGQNGCVFYANRREAGKGRGNSVMARV